MAKKIKSNVVICVFLRLFVVGIVFIFFVWLQPVLFVWNKRRKQPACRIKEFEQVNEKKKAILHAHPQMHCACIHHYAHCPACCIASQSFVRCASFAIVWTTFVSLFYRTRTTLWHDGLAFGLWNCNCNLFMHFSDSYFVYRPISVFYSVLFVAIARCCCRFANVFIIAHSFYLNYNSIRSKYGLHQFDILFSLSVVFSRLHCMAVAIFRTFSFTANCGLCQASYAFFCSPVKQHQSERSVCMCPPKTEQF